MLVVLGRWHMTKILILGGYGNFGKRIARALVKKKHQVIIAGRNADKARKLAIKLESEFGQKVQTAIFDANYALEETLKKLKPAVLINTIGPFQRADYKIAWTCITQKIHYVDLADGRAFVTGFKALDGDAKKAGICAISGASTVPGLSSAVLEHFSPQFSQIEQMRYGISPGQAAERGLATTKAILGYVGKPLAPFSGSGTRIYGWQDIYRQPYPELGKRWMGNCDIPDLDLLPEKYGIKKIRFSAGMELSLLHLGLWGLGWLVWLGLAMKLSLPLEKLAGPLLAASYWFNGLGSDDGGMHIILSGKRKDGKALSKQWFIIAKAGDGPQIPTIPAIILAEKLAQKNPGISPGAWPCVGLVTLDDYLAELSDFAVSTFERDR